MKSGEGGAVDLLIHAQPGAKRSEIAGVHDGRLKLRVAAPPVDGEANREIVRYLAKLLVIRRSQIRIRSGETSRKKLLTIAETDPDTIIAKILSQIPQ